MLLLPLSQSLLRSIFAHRGTVHQSVDLRDALPGEVEALIEEVAGLHHPLSSRSTTTTTPNTTIIHVDGAAQVVGVVQVVGRGGITRRHHHLLLLHCHVPTAAGELLRGDLDIGSEVGVITIAIFGDHLVEAQLKVLLLEDRLDGVDERGEGGLLAGGHGAQSRSLPRSRSRASPLLLQVGQRQEAVDVANGPVGHLHQVLRLPLGDVADAHQQVALDAQRGEAVVLVEELHRPGHVHLHDLGAGQAAAVVGGQPQLRQRAPLPQNRRYVEHLAVVVVVVVVLVVLGS